MYAGVFRGEPAGDDLTFHLAEATRLADCIAAGDFDWWNPSANAGFASAYYYQVIPQLFSGLLAAITGIDVLLWFQLSVLLPLMLAPVVAYRALRMLDVARWPAVAGAFCLVMCASSSRWGHGADGTFSVGLLTQTWALALFPLALAAGVRWVRDGRALVVATAAGLFAGLCHPFVGIALGIALFGCALLLPRMGDADDCRPPYRTMLHNLGRLSLLGGLLVLGSACGWLPVVIDYEGFGGFPHRVADEVGPGPLGLLSNLASGAYLDEGRASVLSLMLLVSLLVAHRPALAWLWCSALGYLGLLAAGPYLVTDDDLFPAIRLLGPLQVVLALAAALGACSIGTGAWRWAEAQVGPWRLPARTLVACVAGVFAFILLVDGARLQRSRVSVADDGEELYRDELTTIMSAMVLEPEGRKQARAGNENHWFNLLPYVHGRRTALLQMGGAALQASPNYTYLWHERDAARTAWVFDAPLVLFRRDQAATVPPGETVVETAHHAVRRLASPGMVSPAQVIGQLPSGRFAARAAALDWLRGDAALRDELLAYAGDRGWTSAPDGRVHEVRRQLSPGDLADVVADVEAFTATTFVIRESWHPRWRAQLDGRELPIRRVTPDFMAVDVPAGRHQLELRFHRPWWAWATWSLIAVAIGLSAWLGRRRSAPTSM
jgi:hypothetical protein